MTVINMECRDGMAMCIADNSIDAKCLMFATDTLSLVPVERIEIVGNIHQNTEMLPC